MNRTLAIILIIVLFFSCKTLPCIETNPGLYFVSFSDTETDSIILKKYVKNSDFKTIVDSTIITRGNSMYIKSNDTLQIISSNSGDYGLDIKFDYEIYIPLAGKLFQLSNFVEQQTERNVGLSLDKTVCVDPIKSYTLNGQVVIGASDYHLIYLNK